jgi:hypothetical protein
MGMSCSDRPLNAHNNRINADWQFRCAPLPAGYAERYSDKSQGKGKK